jgi:hypothetical protein
LATVGIEMLKILPAVPAKKVPKSAVASNTRLIRFVRPGEVDGAEAIVESSDKG